jgi:hypothetical protein
MTDDATRFAQLDGPYLRGQATEAVVRAEFLERGIPVLVREYDNEPRDLVIDYAETFYRLQAKTGYDHNGTVTFETVSTWHERMAANGTITANTSMISWCTVQRRNGLISSVRAMPRPERGSSDTNHRRTTNDTESTGTKHTSQTWDWTE